MSLAVGGCRWYNFAEGNGMKKLLFSCLITLTIVYASCLTYVTRKHGTEMVDMRERLTQSEMDLKVAEYRIWTHKEAINAMIQAVEGLQQRERALWAVK